MLIRYLSSLFALFARGARECFNLLLIAWEEVLHYPKIIERAESNIVDESSGPKFDVISELIDMNMSHIVHKILLNLSEADVANAVTANPKWATFVTSRRRAEQYFSKQGHCAPLKTLYRRRELLSKEDQRDARAIFEQSCADRSKLSKLSAKWCECSDEFSVVFPYDCFNRYEGPRHVYIGNDYIAPIHAVCAEEDDDDDLHEYMDVDPSGFVIQLYDRWTLQLVNAVSVPDIEVPLLDFIGDLVVIRRFTENRSSALVAWNQASGKVHLLRPAGPSMGEHMFCVSNLIVLLISDGCDAFASVYKCDNETGRAPQQIMDEEPLNMFYNDSSALERPIEIRSDESLDLFGIVGLSNDGAGGVYQLRSKHDFSLRSVSIDSLQTRPLSFTTSYLLSDRLVLVNTDGGNQVDVFWLSGGRVSQVYTFSLPEEYFSLDFIFDGRNICLVGFDDLDDRLTDCTTIWKLPSNLVDICSRHFKEGTVGTCFECDLLVRQEIDHSLFDSNCYMKFDRYGVTVVHEEIHNSACLHVTMLNSVILDGESC